MALQKREKKREGVTFLFYGLEATGKTPTGLSFPKQILFDSDGGTKFYGEYDKNILMESNTLVFKEMNEDLDDLERDEDLFNEVETLNVDSITRYYENMQHAALKVAEQRAMKAGRAVEAEGISVKERGVMKLHYERFFARLLTYVKMGKNLVFVAEQTDLNENRTDAAGNQTSVKVGIKPNMQKDSKFDFDVVVNTYTKDGKSFGKIEKDRTKTFQIGDVVEMPNYSHWEDAIQKAREGKIRTKDDIKSFDDTINKEVSSLKDESGDNVQEVRDQIQRIIDSSSKEKQTKLAEAFKANFKTMRFKEETNVKILEGMLKIARETE